MPLMLSVFNTTMEKFRRQIQSQGFTFMPRAITKVPEQFEEALKENEKQGLIIIKPGDDLKAKENEGLKNYLGHINERLHYFNMYMDEKKRNGVTINEPRDYKKLLQWKEEIEKRLEMTGGIEDVPSFLNEPSLDDKKLFEGEMEVQEIKAKPKTSKTKPSKSSFADMSILDEVEA